MLRLGSVSSFLRDKKDKHTGQSRRDQTDSSKGLVSSMPWWIHYGNEDWGRYGWITGEG
jgi:hypothetical protein